MTDSPAGPQIEDAEEPDLDPRTAALAAALLEIDRHAGTDPLTGPRLFALVLTAPLLQAQPAFAELLDEPTRAAAAADPHHLTSVELEAPPGVEDPREAVLGIAWPGVDGAAVVADLPAEAWRQGDGPVQLGDPLAGHGLRVAAGALTDGTTWCAVRGGEREDLLLGPALVPALVEALLAVLGADPTGDQEPGTD
ncbi:hypothetical protein JSY14_02525 [Brachybacterium sp. EF45031]|uniref:PPA1309 family protein n=1 Tax=Brachybacterium sillae TaxID=2810536 RepID=UPI00217E62C3|nr:PPA1309 family protein [Brachybacterium sillae]MCS6710947.1 hypothetical protein [Brachybacterium sillae]